MTNDDEVCIPSLSSILLAVTICYFQVLHLMIWSIEKKKQNSQRVPGKKLGGAPALRAPTLGQECRQTWLLRKMFRWQCVLSVDLFRTCLHKVMTELIFNFSLHTTHNGIKIILKLLRVHLLFNWGFLTITNPSEKGEKTFKICLKTN